MRAQERVRENGRKAKVGSYSPPHSAVRGKAVQEQQRLNHTRTFRTAIIVPKPCSVKHCVWHSDCVATVREVAGMNEFMIETRQSGVDVSGRGSMGTEEKSSVIKVKI